MNHDGVYKFDPAGVVAEEYFLPRDRLIAGNATTVAAGDSLVVPRGFVGTWEVVEPTSKTYVIYEPGA